MKEIRVFLDVKSDTDITGIVDEPGLHVVNADSIIELENALREWYKETEGEDITIDYLFDRPKGKFFNHD